MDQKAFLALTAMLNSFPQGAANPDLTMGTYEAVLRDVTSQAIIEAAQRFTAGDVPEQSRTFAPSVAEFVQQARFIAQVIPLRGRERLPSPSQYHSPSPRPEERVRMGFKMSLLSKGLDLRQVDRVAEANKRGLEDMMALAQTWGVPIPESLWKKVNVGAAQ